MLVDLSVRHKIALVLGDGESAIARRDALEREGARVVLARAPSERKGKRAHRGRAGSAPAASNLIALVREVRPVVVFSTLQPVEVNRAIAEAAHSVGALFHLYDAPALSDFTVPSTGRAGSIRLAVSTAGRSPAMAVLLRRRLERAIRPTDVALVELQGRLRKTIQRTIPTPDARREVFYRLARHREIARLLRSDRVDEAMTVARKVIASQALRSVSGARQAGR